MNSYIDFQKVIKKGSARLDRITFTKWENGEISIIECYKQFMENNGYKFNAYLGDYNTPFTVDRKLFKQWLNSLGYFRDKRDTELADLWQEQR